MDIVSPYPKTSCFLALGNSLASVHFVIEFAYIKANRNHKNLQFDFGLTSSHQSFVPSVVFNDAESSFCLYESVHSQKGSVDTFKVI